MSSEVSALKSAASVDRPPYIRWTSGWLFSLAIHLICFLTGALLITGHALSPPGNEDVDRGVEVVLARPNADRTTAYFASDSPADARESTAPAAAKPAGGNAPLDAIPETPPPSAGLPALPTLPGISASPGSLVVSPQRTGQGTGKALVLPGLDDAEVIAADLADQARNAGPTGPTATVKVFGSGAAVGRSFVFVIDRSKSMGGDGLGAIEAAAKELKKAIEALGDEQKFQVVAYNEQIVYLDGRRLIPADSQNRARLIRFVSDLGAYGPTEHERALAAALSLKPDAVFLFTDGDDPILNAGQIARLAREAGRTAIHCIRFGSGPDSDPNFMPALAEATRGSYVYVRMR